MLKIGDTIEYLADVSSPLNQKGIRGQIKVIDREIPLWTAKYLLRGGKVRPYDPASPLQLEEEETEPSTVTRIPAPHRDGCTCAYCKSKAEITHVPGAHGPDSVTGTKAEKERRTKTNGQRKSTSERNQTSDHGPKKPDPKRRAGSGGG